MRGPYRPRPSPWARLPWPRILFWSFIAVFLLLVAYEGAPSSSRGFRLFSAGSGGGSGGGGGAAVDAASGALAEPALPPLTAPAPKRPVPNAPTFLDKEFQLGDGPWMRERGRMGDKWERPPDCNPYSGRCDCLRTWLPKGDPDPCQPPAGAKPVRLSVTGWMTEWPYNAGLHRCRRSLCDVAHGPAPGPGPQQPHGVIVSVINAAETKADAKGALLVGVALESRPNKPVHASPAFKYFFDVGVSYARGHLDLATTYNNYFPAQFASKGAPFKQKRDGLFFMHSNCIWEHRNKMFDQIANLTAVESFGSCKRNADAAAVLPQCASLPHVGGSPTVWSQNECMMHHFKFALAIENSRDPDYITEKLWQPLRSGAVPIYWGAPNVREFLPHPDAAVLVEDFPTISDLVSYLKKAASDEKLYAKHMAWKDAPLPVRFMDLVVRRPVDGVYCQVCDAIASRYGVTLGPVVGGRGDGVHVPPCIRASIEALIDPIKRNWHVPAQRKDAGIRTYVLSVRTAEERHKFMAKQLTEAGLAADLVLGLDGADVSDETRRCWAPESPLDSRTKFDRVMGPRVASVAMKHVLAAWDIFDSGSNASIVLEDDAILNGDFTAKAHEALKAAPPGWDLIVLGTCYSIMASPDAPRFGPNGVLAKGRDCSRCAHALMWSYEGAKKLLASLPLRWPLDFQLNMAGKDASWNCYWLEPATSTQSTQFQSMLENERLAAQKGRR